MNYIVHRTVMEPGFHRHIGGSHASSEVYMGENGEDVGFFDAAKYPSKEDAIEAAKRNKWNRRFRSRVTIGKRSLACGAQREITMSKTAPMRKVHDYARTF